jgi:hypothetical protein
MSIYSWSKASFSYHDAGTSPATLTDTNQVFPVTIDATNSPDAGNFPDSCNIQSIEFEFTALSTATTVTVYLARDSNGDIPITPGSTTGATQTITKKLSNSTKGGAAFIVNNDYHRDSDVANTNQYTIYVIAKVDAGTPTANIRINWRA